MNPVINLAEFEAVFFDLDDTLFDHASSAESAIVTILERDYQLLSPEQLQGYKLAWRQIEAEFFAKYAAGELSFFEQRAARAKAFLQLLRLDSVQAKAGVDQALNWDDNQYSNWFINYLEVYQQSWKLFDEVSGFLTKLREKFPQLKLGIITNGDPTQQKLKLEQLGLTDLPAVISGELGIAKPDPRIFETAVSRLAVAVEKSVYVGDNYSVDYLGASGAGLVPVWLNRAGRSSAFSTPESIEITQTISTLEQLL